MKPFFAVGRTFLLCSVALVVIDASALTLGRLRGAAVLGQPLQVTVPVQFSADEDVATSCFHAEVVYGDVRQEAQSVNVRVEIKEDGQSAQVRIRSANRVDEPVVTLILRAGCEQRTSRRYVLLADLPTDTAGMPAAEPVAEVSSAAATKTVASIVATVAQSAAPAPASPSSEKTKSSADSAAKNEKRRKVEKTPATEVVASTQPRKRPPEKRDVNSKSRLKLAPWDLGPERDPVLKSTDSLLFLEPLENLQKRAEAVAAWRALNMTAEDVLRQEARAQAVESDLKTLKDLTVSNQQSLAEITGRLQQAERERFANPLVYVLLLLVLGFATVVVLLWNRLRDTGRATGPWWRGEAVPQEAAAMAESRSVAVVIPQVFTHSSVEVVSPEPASFEVSAGRELPTAGPVDVDVLLGDSVFGNLSSVGVQTPSPSETIPAAVQPQHPSSTRQRESKDFGASVSGALRAINTREMLDARQQAEFFMTLGQYEEAIAVLEDSIASSESANPMVFLDLLKIFHTLSRKEEYDRYREEFNQEFTGRVPVYVGFNQGGKSLEAYADIVERVVGLWPTEDCMEYLETCLVRNPSDPPDSGMDLEAFRDLLMLHGVLRRLDDLLESAMVPFSALRQTQPSNDKAVVSTIPVLPQPEPVPAVLDLELDIPPTDAPADNLIDFDVSGFSKSVDISKAP